ncbi:MAG: DUF6671 family protein [Cyanobium sp.]
MPLASVYAGLRICLSTQHGKERALARPFSLGLGASLTVSPCNTDVLGTFSGEVERLEDAFNTCRSKALMGLEQSGLRLGLASEASFGPHPAAPMLAVGQELLLFVDLDRGLHVLEQRLDWRTNYAQKLLEPHEDPAAWLKQVGFPSHAVMARPADASQGRWNWQKDLSCTAALIEALEVCRRADAQGQVWLEADMRAHRNPTRMRSIRRVGVGLARRLGTPCPSCTAPGWGLLDSRGGLPCRSCGTATELTATEIWGCVACGHQVERPRRDGLSGADPGHCPWCNP